MIAEPPLLAGAVQVKATCALPAVPDTDVGAPGGAAGVTELEDAELPRPTALIAVTRNVYAVPFVKPVTVVEVVADVPSANIVHVDPFIENSTR